MLSDIRQSVHIPFVIVWYTGCLHPVRSGLDAVPWKKGSGHKPHNLLPRPANACSKAWGEEWLKKRWYCFLYPGTPADLQPSQHKKASDETYHPPKVRCRLHNFHPACQKYSRNPEVQTRIPVPSFGAPVPVPLPKSSPTLPSETWASEQMPLHPYASDKWHTLALDPAGNDYSVPDCVPPFDNVPLLFALIPENPLYTGRHWTFLCPVLPDCGLHQSKRDIPLSSPPKKNASSVHWDQIHNYNRR